MDRRGATNHVLILAWTALLVGLHANLAPHLQSRFPSWVLALLLVPVWLTGLLAVALREARQWRRMGSALGAEFRPAPGVAEKWAWITLPDLHFRALGLDVEVHTYQTSSRGDRTGAAYTRFRIPLETVDSGFRLKLAKDRGLAARLDPFRGEDVPIGARPFDDRVHVEASDPELPRNILESGLREALLALKPLGATHVSGEKLEHVVEGRILDPEALRTRAEALARLAVAVERALPRPVS